MKRFIAGILVGMLLMCGVTVAAQSIAQTVNYRIVVNGQTKQLGESPVSINDRTYLPVRAVAEMLGYDVGFDNATSTINMTARVVKTQSKPEPIKYLIADIDGKRYSMYGGSDAVALQDGKLMMTLGEYPALISIKNSQYKVENTQLPGGLLGIVTASRASDYVKSANYFVDPSKINSEAYTIYTITNTTNSKSANVDTRTAISISGRLMLPLDDTLKQLDLPITYTIDKENDALIIHF